MVRVLRHRIDVRFKAGAANICSTAPTRVTSTCSAASASLRSAARSDMRDALKNVDSDLPNRSDGRLDTGRRSGRLLRRPFLDKAFSQIGRGSSRPPSGSRSATAGRTQHCSHSFHGLTSGALSLIGFRDRFGPAARIALRSISTISRAGSALARVSRGLHRPSRSGQRRELPDDGYLRRALELCRKYGTIFIADEIRPALVAAVSSPLSIGASGRTWCCWRNRSGDYAGGRGAGKEIFEKCSTAWIARSYGSTFARTIAMAAGIATLESWDRCLIEMPRLGDRLRQGCRDGRALRIGEGGAAGPG